MADIEARNKLNWILECGWKGLCPRCGKGHMFGSWLKIVDTCEHCGLDYRFAAPDDGPAFFSQCFIALPLTFFVVWLQVALNPPVWVHLIVSLPLMAIGCAAACAGAALGARHRDDRTLVVLFGSRRFW